MPKSRKLRLGAFLLGTGHHLASGHHPAARKHGSIELDHYIQLAKTAEEGLFDAVFLADILGTQSVLRSSNQVGFEPLTLLSALSQHTSKIGLVATVSTSYLEPFHLARKFASLDRLSGGRAAWNLVTSGSDLEAKNFGLDQQILHATRYEKAQEYLDVVKGLWDSFEDDALETPLAQPQKFDSSKVHPLHHKGKHFSVQGPLHAPRPIQGYPVLVQAGSSEDGQNLAAYGAEVVFTAQQNLADAQKFYRGLKSKLSLHGRKESELLIMPGVSPIIGESTAHAQELFEELQNLIPEETGVGLLSAFFNKDLSAYDIDGPLPDFGHTEGNQSRQALFIELAQKENLSIRELYKRIAGARGHWTLVGTASHIADQLQEWFENEGADGFNIMPPVLPLHLKSFVDKVIPELQRRGLFRTVYEGRTLRENLGLVRPEHPKTLWRKSEIHSHVLQNSVKQNSHFQKDIQ